MENANVLWDDHDTLLLLDLLEEVLKELELPLPVVKIAEKIQIKGESKFNFFRETNSLVTKIKRLRVFCSFAEDYRDANGTYNAYYGLPKRDRVKLLKASTLGKLNEVPINVLEKTRSVCDLGEQLSITSLFKNRKNESRKRKSSRSDNGDLNLTNQLISGLNLLSGNEKRDLFIHYDSKSRAPDLVNGASTGLQESLPLELIERSAAPQEPTNFQYETSLYGQSTNSTSSALSTAKQNHLALPPELNTNYLGNNCLEPNGIASKGSPLSTQHQNTSLPIENPSRREEADYLERLESMFNRVVDRTLEQGFKRLEESNNAFLKQMEEILKSKKEVACTEATANVFNRSFLQEMDNSFQKFKELNTELLGQPFEGLNEKQN